jgi:hypothetical protein
MQLSSDIRRFRKMPVSWKRQWLPERNVAAEIDQLLSYTNI